jgi:3,4-dihydroxy 2-butanone 4-phosphate synthase/GTP cyclohydrolase II
MNNSNIIILKGERVKLPTKYGYFEIIPFQEKSTKLEHIALVKGNFTKNDTVLTRIHSSCATGDLFGSLKCDCGEQLIQAIKMIEKNGNGIIVYLQQEGRGIGLMNKMKAYKLQEQGLNTIEANLHLGFAADERAYTIGAEILKSIGINKIDLMTNNPDKIEQLEQNGIKVVKRIPLIIESNKFNIGYLDTKEQQMGHLLTNNHLETQENDQ